ncbi:bacteriohopanetetrol glucosamine biosynthesis glycosyltransferase HpnI [Burkholderia territorii]|uniref:Glycosyltransferase n=1 Tax=Burkholderia territorii TaxID=1503055 RepID=A0A6L3NJ56_9BURK|nr:bacteriohopanetetrol glucosamine biosynthesis glycosyltransferase HpnI [Burkholderia territorii]KAB0683999.1 glycosyltransferase [Burkholderia territorii]MBM2775390.1 bacteriohopanetetrol glucosamine biosynthesis glycosyltransferase HpnI [Burkholderia territorii]VWC03085.1 glucosyltransferase [Burkholderia territorii]
MVLLHVLYALASAMSIACGLCALFAIAYTVTASVLVGRFFSRARAEPRDYPGVTVAKPLHGDEWNLAQHLESFFVQDYPGPVQHLFGVHDAGDAALAAVETLRTRYPDANIKVVADARLYGPNRKIANLVNMLEHAEHSVLCLADSDVLVERDYLRAVVSALQQPEVGIVTSVYRGVASPGFWPGVAVAMTNYHFLPGVVTGLFIGRARPCFGQTIAIARSTLERIGGLARFAHHLAEDHALGEAVRQVGAQVVVPPFVVGHACVEETFAALYAHELRWSCTIRAADRLGHAGSVLMHPLPLALLAALFSGGTPAAWWLAFAALVARALLMLKTSRATGAGLRGALWLPFVDLLQFVVFVSSFFSSHVVWRGTRFRVDREGLLSPAGKS